MCYRFTDVGRSSYSFRHYFPTLNRNHTPLYPARNVLCPLTASCSMIILFRPVAVSHWYLGKSWNSTRTHCSHVAMTTNKRRTTSTLDEQPRTEVITLRAYRHTRPTRANTFQFSLQQRGWVSDYGQGDLGSIPDRDRTIYLRHCILTSVESIYLPKTTVVTACATAFEV
jgi:hypothetical protein